MTEFDAEQFEAEKYRDYFTELQQAYKAAFGRMRDEYDSTLVHAVDQAVLNESEPFFEDGTFHIEMPEEPSPADRVERAGVVVEAAKLDAMLEDYRETLTEELEYVFGLAERPDTDGGGATDVHEENA